QGFDFSQYDSDNNGYIDAINCMYAGYSAEGLYAHCSWITSFSADGVSTHRYQICSMYSYLRLGTFCHENGHLLCFWPDLYDSGRESNGVGYFCLMSYYHSYTNPVEPCAYLKDLAGWANTTLLTTSQTGLTATAGVNQVYKFEHPTLSNEYYLIENRQETGRDVAMNDSGLAIWHIDTTGDNDNQEMTPESHYECTLVQADGNWDLENDVNAGDSTDLYKAPTFTECGPYTYPNTNWWDGSPSTLGIFAISASGPTMTFSYGSPRIVLDPVSIERDVYLGEGPESNDFFTVANELPIPLTYTITDDTDWLSVSPTSGTTSGGADTIEVIYDGTTIAGWPRGHYTANITVSAGDVLNSPQTLAVTLSVLTVAPDFDGDYDVDMEDFGHLQLCYTGSGVLLIDPACQDTDLDRDLDVDQLDFDVLYGCLSGTNVPAPRECDD
ncbi:MAG: hypothetical protein JSV03_09465, partial [Planctomycetota bacterium]